MTQLMFNNDFDDIIEEPLNYWKSIEEVPLKIKDFIMNISNSLVIYDSNKYYCSKCLNPLKNNICSNCNREYIIDKNDNKIIKCSLNEIKDYHTKNWYYVFDVIGENVLLYIFKEQLSYRSPLISYPYKTSKIEIEKVYQIFPNKICELKSNKFYYKEITEDTKYMYYGYFGELNTNFLGFYEDVSENAFLYAENLEELKNTKLYKYSNIWNLKDRLKGKNISLLSLVFHPVYFKEFEYLIKMELYNLAFNYCPLIEYKNNFKDTFGLEKKYYQIMKENDVSYFQLQALQICPTTDIKLLNFVSECVLKSDILIIEDLSQYIKFEKLKDYFQNQKLNENNIYEYYDYIRCCREMELNLKDNKILFPNRFIEKHDAITSQMIITSNPETDKKIKSLSNMFTLNKYEDDKYVIFPASSVKSLVDESSQQSNCVRTYCDIVSNNECQIYFMREKNNINKSLVTIEVRNGKIVQAKTKFNEEPSDDIKKVLKNWEKQMIPIININEDFTK